MRDMVGMIEGDKVTLRSVDRRPGNSMTFIFSATLTDGTLSGPIHLGEYLTAKFTAKRHAYTTGPRESSCRADRRSRRERESWSHDEKLFPPSPAFPASRRSGSRLPPLRRPVAGPICDFRCVRSW